MELLIGFDARENFLRFKNTWSPDRIDQYLLKANIIKPMSVDVMVWDTLFHQLDFRLPDWIGPRQAWDSLERLYMFINSINISSEYWVIAITQWTSVDQEAKHKEAYDVHPSSVSDDWTLLGFDIADEFLLSGLMNCGYWPEEREVISKQFAGHLNEHHLFDDLDIALRFKTLSDQRVIEHSPFNVYGIYLVESVDTGQKTIASR